jgi:hypothetical protein
VRKPFPEEFRRDVIAVARQGDQSRAEVARSFRPQTTTWSAASSPRRRRTGPGWLGGDERDGGSDCPPRLVHDLGCIRASRVVPLPKEGSVPPHRSGD